MTISKEISETIRFMRFPLAVLVVFIHANGMGGAHFIMARIVAQIAVPLFFMISGCLFFNGVEKWDWNKYISNLQKRIYSLVIPYILWITLWLLFNAFFLHDGNTIDYIKCHLYLGIFVHCNITDTGYIDWSGHMGMMRVPLLIPFWYIRDLMIVVIFSPIIYWMLRKVRIVYISILLLMYVTMFNPLDGLIDTRALVFFSLGGFISYKHIEASFSPKIAVFSSILFFLFVIINISLRQLLPITVLIGMTAFYTVSYWMVNSMHVTIPKCFVNSTFFVFAFHYFILTLIESMCCVYILNVFVASTLSVLGYIFVNSCYPKLSHLLTGR